jgi:hypothetical protein
MPVSRSYLLPEEIPNTDTLLQYVRFRIASARRVGHHGRRDETREAGRRRGSARKYPRHARLLPREMARHPAIGSFGHRLT